MKDKKPRFSAPYEGKQPKHNRIVLKRRIIYSPRHLLIRENMMDIIPSEPYITVLPILVVLGALVFVVLLLILALLLRGGQVISRKTGGALAVTVALMVLFSGLWCAFLSPPVTYTEYKDSLYRNISVEGQSSWNYTTEMLKGDTMDGSVSLAMILEGQRSIVDNKTSPTFNLFIYDPDGNTVWSQINVTYSYFTVKALKPGLYEIKIHNPNTQAINGYVSFYVQGKVTLRPLEPLGQWLSLISLPLLGLGAWASGIYPRPKKEQTPS